MNVLALTLRYPPYTAGGYELLTRDAVEALRARGHSVRVLAGHGAAFAGDDDVLPLLSPGLDGDQDPWQLALEANTAERFRLHFLRHANYAATRRAVRATRPDVCLFFNLGLVSLAPLLALRHAGVPTLGFVADPWPTNHWLTSWKADERAAREKAWRLAVLERAWRTLRDLVELGPLLAASDYLRDLLVESGIPAESVEVLPLGLPPDMTALAGRNVTEGPRSRLADEPLRVVCASSLWEGKGQHVLVDAVAAARANGVDVALTLAGGGLPSYRAELEARVATAELSEHVRFAGALTREELSRLFGESHVMAVPSTWGEPFGLVTLEGMSHGLAVVVSDAGASPELVEDGVDGRIVPAGDAAALGGALIELARDDGRRLTLAHAGRDKVQGRFAYEAFVNILEMELASVVEEA